MKTKGLFLLRFIFLNKVTIKFKHMLLHENVAAFMAWKLGRIKNLWKYKGKCISQASHWPYGVTVAEVKGRDNLSEELAGFFGSQPAFLYQVVKQLPTRHMLQYQIPEIQTGKSQVFFICHTGLLVYLYFCWECRGRAVYFIFRKQKMSTVQRYLQVFVIFIDIIELQNMRVLY